MGNAENASFEEQHAAWHAGIEAWRSGPHGPLSVVGLHWLDETPKALPGVPGLWSASPELLTTAVFEASDGVARDGEPLVGAITVGPLKGIEAELLEWGEKRIQVAARSERIAVRPIDPAAELRAEYDSTATFPPNQTWVVPARFEADPREAVQVDTIIDGMVQYYDSPGRAHFEIDGEPYSLTLFGTAEATDLMIHFTDPTSRDLTYPAVRWVRAQRDGDAVTIDFNRAMNPPCAYSENATCPLAPPENRLPFRVEAGELRPGVTV